METCNMGMCDYEATKDYANTVQGFHGHNKLRVTKIEKNYAECEVELTSEGLNPAGMAHGGLIFSLCDLAAQLAVCSDVNKGSTTLSANINHLRPGTGKFLRAVGIPVRIGSKIAVSEATVYDDRDRVVAKGTYTFFFLS